MKKGLTLVGALLTAIIWVTVMIVGWSVGRGAAPSAQLAGVVVNPAANHYYISIDTPAMLGGDEATGPAYVPSAMTLPANTDVTVTITNFDGATALPSGSEQYAKATGIKGSLTIEAIDTVHPNATGAVTTATSLDPATGMSHTFTIAKLGLNVPLAPQSSTTFTFHTGAAGVYDWRCMDPCGSGPAGWGAAMSNDGFMQGKVTFA